MYLRRHCYDKPWRCPGWSGGGWRYTDDTRCESGHLDIFDGNRFPSWRFSRCNRCDVRAIPYVTRWLDWTYVGWRLMRFAGHLKDRWEGRRW
jgi:hypothetical protein